MSRCLLMRASRPFWQSCHLDSNFPAWTATWSCSTPGPGLCTVFCRTLWIFLILLLVDIPFLYHQLISLFWCQLKTLLGLHFVPFSRSLVKMLNSVMRYREYATVFLSRLCLTSLLTALTQSATEEKKKIAVETAKSPHFKCEQHHVDYAMETTYISKIAQPDKDNPKSTLNR